MPLKRLLMVSEPGNYGVFSHVRNLVEFLHRQHPETTLDLAYSTRRTSPALVALVAAVESWGGQTLDLQVGNAPEWGDFSALRKLNQHIARYRPDLIHAHSSKAGALCRFLKLRPGLPPVLYSPHAYYGMAPAHGSRLAMSAFNGVEMALGPLGVTLTHSTDERDFAVRKLKQARNRTLLIHYGIDRKRFAPARDDEKSQLKAALQIPCDRPLLVSVGRHSFQKNYPPLYEALEKLLSAPQPLFRFAHAGNGAGELAQGLSMQARRYVHSYEFLPDVERLLHAADAFVLTSRYEASSIAAMEALACGIKVFLTRVIGSASYAQLGFGDITYISPADHGPQLSQNIRQALHDWFSSPECRRGVIMTQVELVGQWFDRDTQYEEHWRLYCHLSGAGDAGQSFVSQQPELCDKEPGCQEPRRKTLL